MLNDTSDSYLANIASWADSYRYETAGKWSAALHYIDAEDDPPTSCGVDFERDCGDAGCVVSAITNYTQRIGDGRLSAANTQQALKFLVHFLGDITQPLHDEAYETGGNGVDVTYQGQWPFYPFHLWRGTVGEMSTHTDGVREKATRTTSTPTGTRTSPRLSSVATR